MGSECHFAWQQFLGPNVRFGSKADIGEGVTHVRFTPKSGHWNSPAECPLCAKSGHERALFDHLVGNGERARRYSEAKLFGRSKIDDQFELCRTDNR